MAEVGMDGTQRFRLLADLSPYGILIRDPELRCTYANTAWLKISGLSYAEALGTGACSIIYPEDIPPFASFKAKARRTQHPSEVTLRYQLPSGSDPPTVTDYLYLGQLLHLLTHGSVSDVAGPIFEWSKETKGKINEAVSAVASVSNDIAHVREVDCDRLPPAPLAASEIRNALAQCA